MKENRKPKNIKTLALLMAFEITCALLVALFVSFKQKVDVTVLEKFKIV